MLCMLKVVSETQIKKWYTKIKALKYLLSFIKERVLNHSLSTTEINVTILILCIYKKLLFHLNYKYAWTGTIGS